MTLAQDNISLRTRIPFIQPRNIFAPYFTEDREGQILILLFRFLHHPGEMHDNLDRGSFRILDQNRANLPEYTLPLVTSKYAPWL